MTNTRPHGNDPKSTSIFENRRKSTSIGSFLSSFHCSYFMTPWVHVAACVASAENDPFFDHALYAATSIFFGPSTSIGSFLSSFHCSYLMTPWVHMAACVAPVENDPKTPNALYTATWTQGVIKYEQWKLERKLPMLVLFRPRSIWPRVRHFQDVIVSKAKKHRKNASSYDARHYRAEADQKRTGS